MLKLGGKVIQIQSSDNSPSTLFSISTNSVLPAVLKSTKAYLVRNADMPKGFAHYLLFDSMKALVPTLPVGADYTLLPEDYAYLGDGDVIRLSSDRAAIRVLYRAASRNNSILVTEQCNHYCLMCSQPPKKADGTRLGSLRTNLSFLQRLSRNADVISGQTTTDLISRNSALTQVAPPDPSVEAAIAASLFQTLSELEGAGLASVAAFESAWARRSRIEGMRS